MMNRSQNEDKNFIIARDLSTKFEFYFIALVFTVLGLSIQTSSFIGSSFQFWLEIISWLSFLVSGLVGLSRLELLAVLYRHHGTLMGEKNELDKLNAAINGRLRLLKNGEEVWTIGELKSEASGLGDQMTLRKSKVKELDSWMIWLYMIHKYAFVLGLFLLILSRAVVGFESFFVD